MLDRASFAPARQGEIRRDPYRSCVEALDVVERLHRLCLDVVKDELIRLGVVEVAPVQALLLFRIGPRELAPVELTDRGYYRGSNVSYTLNKLVQGGFLHSRRHPTDGRVVLISLTERGLEIRDIIVDLFYRHAEEIDSRGESGQGKLDALCSSLGELERFWIDERFRY